MHHLEYMYPNRWVLVGVLAEATCDDLLLSWWSSISGCLTRFPIILVNQKTELYHESIRQTDRLRDRPIDWLYHIIYINWVIPPLASACRAAQFGPTFCNCILIYLKEYYCIFYIIISGGPLSALTCCVNVRLLSAIKKISPLIYSQSWVGSWVYTTQAMMTFTLIF